MTNGVPCAPRRGQALKQQFSAETQATPKAQEGLGLTLFPAEVSGGVPNSSCVEEASKEATEIQETSPTATKTTPLHKGRIFFGNLTPNLERKDQHKSRNVHYNNSKASGTAGWANTKTALPLHQHKPDSRWGLVGNWHKQEENWTVMPLSHRKLVKVTRSTVVPSGALQAFCRPSPGCRSAASV